MVGLLEKFVYIILLLMTGFDVDITEDSRPRYLPHPHRTLKKTCVAELAQKS